MNKYFTSRILTDTTYFTIAFFSLLALDLLVKFQLEAMPYRYISKTLLIGLLIGYYIKNQKEAIRKNFWLMITALSCFMIGDWLLIITNNIKVFTSGVVFFILGKVFYAIRFSNQRDFKLSRLIPFLFCCFLYILWIMNLIYDNLHDLFFPTLIYFFVVVISLQLAFLRKDDVNKLSYILVFIGVIASVASDSITALKVFYMPNFAHEKVTIMLFYGISQYLIVIGITREIKQPEDEFILASTKVDSVDYL